MMKKALVALAFSGMALSAQAGALLAEGFEDVGGLAAKGWVLKNGGTPPGLTSGWAQGSSNIFPALSGPANSYASANYLNAAAGGDLNTWLITSEFSTGINGATVSFWLRADAYPGTSDQIAFGFGNANGELNSFVLGAPVTVGTDGWARYEVMTAGGQGNARFALQYTGAADFANYVGVDSLLVSEVPEPSTMLSLFAGAMGLALVRRRKRG
ncbi:choice-of-anchor J family PEP-CTERM protein [Massilia litorea]|uniref:PEP-CTERM sorting domain-containing protein n=1 Tax=Massilia litorea TaxID=2769491 RepID=A0A7L9U5J8_9BURK|nr:choice-of-anchor J domain-containing protein [Massilia litorea]QOL50268.1 PEP-CTERM sorting domain-containing protein [Massilia litorea]